MEVKNATLGDTPTLVVSGDIDENTQGDLWVALERWFKSGHNILFLDLSEVGRIDEAGMAVLASGVQALGGRGWLGLIAPNAEVHAALEAEGLVPHPQIRLFATRQAARMITGERAST